MMFAESTDLIITLNEILIENGNAITDNGVRYRKMVLNFLWPEINNVNVEDM